jgi:hydrogenase maturation factor
MDWLVDNLDWPMLVLALVILYQTTRTIKMSAEVVAMNAEVARLVVVCSEAVAKIQALHDASAAGINPADVVAATATIKTAVDAVAAMVETPVPAPVSVAPPAA